MSTEMDLVTLFLSIYNYKNKTIKNNFEEGLIYMTFGIIAVFVSKFASDRTFSGLITLAAAVQCLGFLLLRMKVKKQGAAGISSRSLQLFAVMYVMRLYSTLQYNGYLPVDRSGDWVYQAIDVIALVVVVSLLHLMHSSKSQSYEAELDTCSIHWILLASSVIAYFIHPSLNNRQIPDIAWTMSLYLEALAMIPQLTMFAKKGGEVEDLASHYVACVFASRCLTLCFWSHSFHELHRRNEAYNLPGYGVIGAQCLQVVLFADFMYYYGKGVYNQQKLVLPVSI